MDIFKIAKIILGEKPIKNTFLMDQFDFQGFIKLWLCLIRISRIGIVMTDAQLLRGSNNSTTLSDSVISQITTQGAISKVETIAIAAVCATFFAGIVASIVATCNSCKDQRQHKVDKYKLRLESFQLAAELAKKIKIDPSQSHEKKKIYLDFVNGLFESLCGKYSATTVKTNILSKSSTIF